jgi:acyl carrier protein
MMLDRVNLETRIVGIVQDILASNAILRPAGIDDALSELGMTSMNMVTLMLTIEDDFGIVLPKADLNPNNFRTVGTIEALVARLQRR